MRLVARCRNIIEAETISTQYQMKGFQTKIIKKGNDPIVVFEVWATKEEFLT